jgi:RNA polymerase sigma-70 factor (ECF subfamily)
MPHLSLIANRAADGKRDDAAEADLLRRIAAGERAALEALYRCYHRRIDRFLARVSRRADLVEEAINDTFWAVWQQAARFRGDSRPSTWIMGIAYRCALKALRQHGDEPQEYPADLDLPDGVDAHSAHETNEWIAKALCHLTHDQRLTLELAYGAGHTLEEVAAIMSCQVSTVKARMFHARVKLRHLLPALAGTDS